MRKILLSIFIAFIGFPILAQVEDKPLIYNYDDTRHEIAMDIVPILGGNLPSSFFYRKNYLSPTGNWRGFRVNLVAGNHYNAVDRSYENTEFTREANLNYQVSLGTEWQRPVLHNFIAYHGVDLGAGYNRQRFYGVETGLGPMGITSFSFQNINVNAAGFWGVKYHLMARLSVFAEMGIVANYSDNASLVKRNFYNARHERIDSFNNLSLNLLPLRALRVAYHF